MMLSTSAEYTAGLAEACGCASKIAEVASAVSSTAIFRTDQAFMVWRSEYYYLLAMNDLEAALPRVNGFLTRVTELNRRYHAGELRVHVPDALQSSERPLEELIGEHLPASHAALQAASRSLFFSLPVP